MKETDDIIKYIWDNAPDYAKAKGELAELETYKSSLKAIQMKKSSEQSLGAQEREAYASQEYQDICKAIGVATENIELGDWIHTHNLRSYYLESVANE